MRYTGNDFIDSMVAFAPEDLANLASFFDELNKSADPIFHRKVIDVNFGNIEGTVTCLVCGEHCAFIRYAAMGSGYISCHVVIDCPKGFSSRVEDGHLVWGEKED